MIHTRKYVPGNSRGTPRLARTGPDDLVVQRSVRVGVSLHLSDPEPVSTLADPGRSLARVTSLSHA